MAEELGAEQWRIVYLRETPVEAVGPAVVAAAAGAQVVQVTVAEPPPQTRTAIIWQSFSRRVLRLQFKRTCFGLLGGHLNAIKARGRR